MSTSTSSQQQPQDIITQVSPHQQDSFNTTTTTHTTGTDDQSDVGGGGGDYNSIIHLNIRGKEFTITRDDLMSLPESILLCLFPNGVFLDVNGNVINNLTEDDIVYVNFDPQTFQYIINTFYQAQQDLIQMSTNTTNLTPVTSHNNGRHNNNNNNNNNNNKMHGITNYNFQIKQKSSTPSSSSSISVTVLDSEDHLIDDSQMTYLYRINNELLNDYKLLFFHYPLPQFRPKGKFKIVGSYNEKHELDRKTKLKFHDDIISCGYNVISVGHEHENDACLLSSSSSSSSSSSNSDKSIWLCYNSITGDSGITKLDKQYVRKLRLFEIDFEKNRILSWKRKEIDNQPFDYQSIYEKPQKKEKEK